PPQTRPRRHRRRRTAGGGFSAARKLRQVPPRLSAPDRRRARDVRPPAGVPGAASAFGKERRTQQAPFAEAEGQAGGEAAKTVLEAATEVDGGRLLEILRRATDLADGVAVPENLREHLVVEHEVVRVRAGGDGLEEFA